MGEQTDQQPSAGKWTVPVEEFAVAQVLNASLQNVTVPERVLVHPKNKRAEVQDGKVPVGGFMGPLSDGIMVPTSEVARIKDVMSTALTKSGTAPESAVVISEAPGPEWAANIKDKAPQTMLKVEIVDREQVNLDAAVAYLKGDKSKSPVNRMMAEAITRKRAENQIG